MGSAQYASGRKLKIDLNRLRYFAVHRNTLAVSARDKERLMQNA